MSSTDPSAGGAAPDRPEPSTMPYEAARDELVEVVRRLESGGADLEESLALWERGEQLAARCQDVLDGALRRLDEAQDGAQPSPDAPAPDVSSSTTATR